MISINLNRNLYLFHTSIAVEEGKKFPKNIIAVVTATTASKKLTIHHDHTAGLKFIQ